MNSITMFFLFLPYLNSVLLLFEDVLDVLQEVGVDAGGCTAGGGGQRGGLALEAHLECEQ